jgi:hypothetical protein
VRTIIAKDGPHRADAVVILDDSHIGLTVTPHGSDWRPAAASPTAALLSPISSYSTAPDAVLMMTWKRVMAYFPFFDFSLMPELMPIPSVAVWRLWWAASAALLFRKANG